MTEQSFGTQHRGTKMTKGLLFIILSLLSNDAVHSTFEVFSYTNRISWKTALHHCNMSTPAVNLTRMRVIDKITLHEEAEAWVGYFQTYEHFLFIGCFPLSAIDSYVSTKFSIGRIKNGPGICYSLCGLQGYIGLQDRLCYCIAKWDFPVPDTQPFNNSCEKPLHCGNGMLCGDHGYSKISVYDEVTISSHDIKGDDSGCLRVTNGKTYKMSVVNCTINYRHLCETQNGQYLNLEESKKEDEWVYSINDCAETGKRPTTFIGNITNYKFPNVPKWRWTSVVRDLVIRNCSDSCTTNGTHSYEGFLKNIYGVIQLEFVHGGDSSRKKSVVCMSGKVNESSAPDNKGAESETTSKGTAGKVNEASTPANKGAESEAKSKETTVQTVLLHVRLAALSLIAVVVLIIVCRKRRKEKATIHVEAPKQTTTEAVVPRNTEIYQSYYEHDNETSNQREQINQGQVSSEYDTFKEQNAPFSAVKGKMYDTANFNTGDGTYDVAFSENNPRQAVQANYYDHVRLTTTDDGKYDHVDLQDRNITVHERDIYDQANAVALDNAYYENF